MAFAVRRPSNLSNPETFLPLSATAGLVGGIAGTTQLVHEVNHTSEYNPIHSQLVHTQSDEETVQRDLHDSHLQGFSGQVAVHGHLLALQRHDTARIKSLMAHEPPQVIGQAPELVLEMGSGLIAAATISALIIRRIHRFSRPGVAY